jgi:hypothetical protein
LQYQRLGRRLVQVLGERHVKITRLSGFTISKETEEEFFFFIKETEEEFIPSPFIHYITFLAGN